MGFRRVFRTACGFFLARMLKIWIPLEVYSQMTRYSLRFVAYGELGSSLVVQSKYGTCIAQWSARLNFGCRREPGRPGSGRHHWTFLSSATIKLLDYQHQHQQPRKCRKRTREETCKCQFEGIRTLSEDAHNRRPHTADREICRSGLKVFGRSMVTCSNEQKLPLLTTCRPPCTESVF